MAQYDGSIRINTKIDTKEASSQLMTLENRIVKTADKVASLRSKMDALKDAKIPTQEYKDIQKQIEDAEKKLIALTERQEKYLATGGKESSSVYKKMNYDAEQLNQTLEYAKGELQDLVNTGKAFTLGSGTEEYLKIGQQLKYAENDLSALSQRYSEMDAKNGSAETSFKSLGDSIRNAFSLLKRSFKDIPIAAAKKGVEGLKASFRGLGSVGKKSLSFMSSKLKNMTASMLGFNKSAKKSSGLLSTLGSRFKGLALSLLIFNQISKAFNAMVSGIREGFSNLANENASFRNQVNGLKASLLTLKNSFAGAFAPIVQVAIPYIQQFIGWLTSAIETVGQFIAALTGRKTYIKAIKQTAGAMEDTAKATKDAKKEAEGYLSPLDEINKYSDGKDKGAGAGGGGGAGGAGQMFEEVPIESRFQNLVDNLKSFIKSEDWEGLGAYIASGINKGLQKIYDVINWDNVGPRITYFVNAFTRTFNSLVDNINWDLMGRTIGAGINTFVNTMNLLIEGIDWQNLGKKFSEGIAGIVDEVNWENFGRFFGNKFMILWNMLYGLVMNLDYGKMGVAIGNGLNGAVKSINLETIGATLGRAITGFFQTAINFAGAFDWKELGRNISNGINRFFQEFDGKTMAQGATKLISGILDTLIEAISTTDWSEVWKDIINFIVNVNWIELIGKLVIAAGQLILGLFNGLVQAIAETDWGAVWDSIIQAFKDFFGIHSQSTVMTEMGKYLIQGLFNGLQSLIGLIKEFFLNLKDNVIIQCFNGIITFIKGVFTGNWRQAWEGIKQILKGIWNGILSIVKSPINGIISLINGMVRAIVSGLNSAIRAFNRIKIPSWVPGIGGRGINISTISAPKIPYLATGTVVPPNREFMAVLGDNKREPEVVSPLSTMKQAVMEAIAESGGIESGKPVNITLQVSLDRKILGQTMVDWGKLQQMATGNNPYDLGTT